MFFQKQYHYLIAGLPELVFDEEKLGRGLLDFREEFKESLSKDDYHLVSSLFFTYDNENLINHFVKEKDDFNPLGNYSLADVEEQLGMLDTVFKQKGGLPAYMVEFIREFKEKKNTGIEQDWEHFLTEKYYHYLLQTKNKFLHDWVEFDLQIKNILTAYYCRKYEINPEGELVGENFITQQLITSNAKDFGISHEVDYLERILQIAEIDNLAEREKQIDLLKWEYIDEHTFFHYFTIEKIIGYMIKLMMVYRWASLDPETGRELFNSLIESMTKSYTFPEEFKIK